ncbi:MAG TPA: twin-arginine translocase TatA/TatE family subunit, partial [Chloroflexota bacterium]|nr:twin-arginine translocase TatA/TatE family subunit [Chloroflexota bacterium]
MFEGILQPTHLILVLIIVLVVFGPGKLPEIGNALGKSLREFKQSVSGLSEASKALPATEGPAQPSSASRCSACHAENPAESEFCGKCG